ncbi:demethoxyubiquinone hydroxylase family protein [Thermincola potens]|uniref:Ferritin/DPS domain-containing protein n=1 Tax=Thermincola potens (strain JR) TaxID=635013 RepID=D5XDM5_THEPJ|nr:demethoxyubiquinone hydroxylase family protein [Thermincola potens]ADG83771.1 conserved hypothetical protein [Thermincola potens JR]
MNNQEVIAKLNWFYSLEVHQVDIYKTQSNLVNDEYLSRALRKFADIEQTHVENIARLIERLGGTPTVIGEVVGEILGKISGRIVPITGLENQLKFNVALEKKAMEDYKDLILKAGREDIFETLWNNLLDEDLHTAWMVNKIEELAKNQSLKA